MGAQEKNGGSAGASRTKATALEMEPMTIAESSEERRSSSTAGAFSRLRSLIVLIKLHMEYYPGITSCLAAIVVVVTVLSIALTFRSKPYTRNQLFHDYSQLDLHHNYQASQVDHWCLWGGDNSCTCDDFTTPLSREEKKGWIPTHFRNTQRIDETKNYDVVFYGDEVAEGWNGMWLGKPGIPSADAFQTKSYFAKTFTREGGGEFEGLALGVMGDDVSLLLCCLDFCWAVRSETTRKKSTCICVLPLISTHSSMSSLLFIICICLIVSQRAVATQAR